MTDRQHLLGDRRLQSFAAGDATMPNITGVLETSLYVADLARSAMFYENVLGLTPMFADDRLRAMSVAGKQVLLLFKRGASTHSVNIPAGEMPPHDGSGQNHLAFACTAEEIAKWEVQLATEKVVIESRIHWERGGTSIYFRDPDGHLVELATPGIWPIY